MRFLRRYTNNRGSALFMVISTMTALMMSCMAMYFSVVSSRSTQYAVFSQQQSKQSADSISEALIAGIMEGKKEMLPLLDEIQKLKVGETLTTDGNGFSAFSPTGTKEDDDNIGAYMVEITKLAENSFDVIVTSSVNGVNSVKHTIVDYSVEDGGSDPAAPTQIFAATGYVPNDVFLEGGTYYAEMFYDNELTILDAFEGIDARVTGDMSIGGSLQNNGGMFPIGTKPVVYAINNTYTSNTSTVSSFASGSKMYVGQDCILNSGGGFENVDIYILGNLYVFSNGLQSKNCNIFVDGDVYIHKDIGLVSCIRANGDYISIEGGGSANEFYIAQNTEWLWSPEKGSYTVNTPKVTKTSEKWDDNSAKKGFMDPDAMLKDLKERTASNNYYKWTVSDKLPKKEIRFSHGSDPISVVELKYDKAKGDTGCEITRIYIPEGEGRQFTDHAIVIDTGDDPDNIYTIRVNALYDLDGDNKPETFMWYPYPYYDASVRMNVIVKGRGSVVVDVPEGVVYQDVNQVKFMHYNWWTICGGRVVNKTVNGKNIKIYAISDGGSWIGGNMESTLSKFIHVNCDGTCKCEYTEKEQKTKCTVHTDQKMITVHCKVHDDIGTYCPLCFPSLVGKDVDHTGDCKYRVGREELDKEFASNSTLKDLMEKDDKGVLIYPTTNIYLVSCEESAEFRFSQFKANAKGVEGNAFFGYVYAPYMTFKGYGDGSGGGWVRLMGGMTVSDYILDDSYTTIACWPEKMPTDLMDDASRGNVMAGFSNKTWKITPKRHG